MITWWCTTLIEICWVQVGVANYCENISHVAKYWHIDSRPSSQYTFFLLHQHKQLVNILTYKLSSPFASTHIQSTPSTRTICENQGHCFFHIWEWDGVRQWVFIHLTWQFHWNTRMLTKSCTTLMYAHSIVDKLIWSIYSYLTLNLIYFANIESFTKSKCLLYLQGSCNTTQ